MMSNSKDSPQKYSIAVNFDEMMTLNTVVTQWLYVVNSQDPKSREEITAMTDLEIGKHFQGSRLSVLSIANILNQPKESVRRRVQKLIDYQLIKKDTNGGLTVSENYLKLIGNFSKQTQIDLTKFLKTYDQHIDQSFK